jgi:hypothetical protein
LPLDFQLPFLARKIAEVLSPLKFTLLMKTFATNLLLCPEQSANLTPLRFSYTPTRWLSSDLARHTNAGRQRASNAWAVKEAIQIERTVRTPTAGFAADSARLQ